MNSFFDNMPNKGTRKDQTDPYWQWDTFLNHLENLRLICNQIIKVIMNAHKNNSVVLLKPDEKLFKKVTFLSK